ncbi:MAG: exodeoxyribonuclease VII small subunit [Chloroflexi bacterium]|nr:exodeoxyribonuclease VII small subunit [Chloroflexota bacterium]
MSKNEKTLSDLSYEQALQELNDIVEMMENEQQPLDETVKIFERGQILAQHCSTLLEKAELKIKELGNSKVFLEKSE